jgi:hypothetical protein
MILKCQCRIQQNGGPPFEWIFEVPVYPNIDPNYAIEAQLKSILSKRAGVELKKMSIVSKKDDTLNHDTIYKEVVNTYYQLKCPNNVFIVDMSITSSYMEAQIQLSRLQDHIVREMQIIKHLMKL